MASRSALPSSPLGLPAAEVRTRFGAMAWSLHSRLQGTFDRPITSHVVCDNQVEIDIEIDPPDAHSSRILFELRAWLHTMIAALDARRHGITDISLRLELINNESHTTHISIKEPTLNLIQWVELVRLRLQTVTLSSPVKNIHVTVTHADQPGHQFSTLSGLKTHDPSSVKRALARLQAAFGPDSTTIAKLHAVHLPEARFRWAPVSDIKPSSLSLSGSSPISNAPMPLIRRFYSRVASQTAHYDFTRMIAGPYRISGGWWKHLVTRDYYFTETNEGTFCWVYFDLIRKTWRLQGVID